MVYAYRLETKRVAEPDFPYHQQKLSSPEEVVKFTASLQDSDIEKLLILHLDPQNRLNCIQIFSGTISHAVIYPREVIKHALLSGTLSIVLVHNHPGGGTNPSSQDQNLTRSIELAGALFDIKVSDHIIIGDNGTYSSMKSNGIICNVKNIQKEEDQKNG